MTFLRATRDDAPALAGLAGAFRNHLGRTLPTDAAFLAGIAQLLQGSDAEFCLALAEGKAVGYGLLRFRFSMWAGGTEAALEDLYVDPAYRGQGLGTGLVRFAIDRARAKPCTSICLDTNENNAASTGIYGRLGFDGFSQRWQGRQIFLRLKLA